VGRTESVRIKSALSMPEKWSFDHIAKFLASLPKPLRVLAFEEFRRPVLWWLFRVYGTSLALAPAGPRGNRFRMWLNPSADSDLIFGTYESNTVEVLTRYLRRGAICADVGANLGYFTILMSRLVGDSGLVIAFEPMPDTLEILRRNIRLNRIDNVSVVGEAASDETGPAQLFAESRETLSKTATMVGCRLEGEVHARAVRAIRLDDYYAEAERLPELIKIDVEGAELAVLGGARETISRGVPTLVIEIHGWGSALSRQVIEMLSTFGYSARILDLRQHEVLCVATRT
jgi:FkbM family methyltransferase